MQTSIWDYWFKSVPPTLHCLYNCNLYPKTRPRGFHIATDSGWTLGPPAYLASTVPSELRQSVATKAP